jgi:hypothetical protein
MHNSYLFTVFLLLTLFVGIVFSCRWDLSRTLRTKAKLLYVGTYLGIDTSIVVAYTLIADLFFARYCSRLIKNWFVEMTRAMCIQERVQNVLNLLVSFRSPV